MVKNVNVCIKKMEVISIIKTEFYRKHEQELRRIHSDIKSELLQETIPFWEERILDKEYPGYFTCFDRTGKLSDTQKPGWFVGRTMYTFAALYNQIEPRQEWKRIAKAGRDMLEGNFYLGDGRFAQMLNRDGTVKTGAVSIFTDHFAVKGLYEYIRTCGKQGQQKDKRLAEMLSEKLFANVKNPAILRMEGIPEGYQKHAVNFMTLLVALESRKLFGDKYEEILISCAEKSLYEFANDEYEVPLEYIGVDGKPKFEEEGRLVDPGHTMESLWFCMRAGKELGKDQYCKRAGKILDWVIDRCYDREYGGFYQHVDIDGGMKNPRFMVNDYAGIPAAWNDKIWWVQAEGLYALEMSALYNENEKHYEYFVKMYDYIQSYFRDRKYGEWYSILKRDGTIRSDNKGFALKGPYHVPRCLLQSVTLLESYLNNGE